MSTELKNIELVEKSEVYTGGFFNIGDKVGKSKDFVITKKLNTNSGEGELYFCQKDGKKYIFKVYLKKNIFSDLAKSLLSLNHKNVMKILDVGVVKNHSYEIDEYYEGGDLTDSLPLNSEEESYKIIAQINEGLNEIHKKGIIHKDIKAENIYFKDSSKNEIAIGDFGISVAYDQKDDVNEHLTNIDNGTDGYKAPEAFNGVISPAVDYYSFGITVWNILTGKNPFVAEDGNPLDSAQIHYETYEDKIKDRLISSTSNLSDKSKKLISGLLVYRHDQRWGYEQVKDFLEGKDVEVYEEHYDLSSFFFNDKEFFNLKELANEIISNQTEGLELIKGTELTRFLDENNLGELTQKITDVQTKYLECKDKEEISKEILGGFESDKDIENYALIKIVYILNKTTSFRLSKYELKTTSEFFELLSNHPMVIRSYLLNESKGLYLWLDNFTYKKDGKSESLSEGVKEFVRKSKNNRILPAAVSLFFRGNKISPFEDKFYANIELSSQKDVYNLEPTLKDRLMYLIDKKDKLLVAWFENVFEVNMNDWYGELEGGTGFYHDSDIAAFRRNKIKAFGKWTYFELFLKKKDVVFRKTFEKDGKYGLWGLDFNPENSELPAQFEEIQNAFVRNSYITKLKGVYSLIIGKSYVPISNENIIYKNLYVFDEREKRNYYIYEEHRITSWEVSGAIYAGEDENGVIQLFNLVGGELKIFHLKNFPEMFYALSSYSEKNHPYERFINIFADGSREVKYALLDSSFNEVGRFSQIQQVMEEGQVPKKLTFWVKDDKGIRLIDKNNNTLESYNYGKFSFIKSGGCFLVSDRNDDKNLSLVTSHNKILFEHVQKIFGTENRNALAIERNYKKYWEIVNLKDLDWKCPIKKFKQVGNLDYSLFAFKSKNKCYVFSDKENGLATTVIQLNKKGGVVTDFYGNSKKFKALNSASLRKACFNPKDENTRFCKNLLGFDGKNFYKYDFEEFGWETLNSISSFSEKSEEEFNDLMNNIESKDIVSLVKNHIRRQKYEAANIIINLTWKYYFDKNEFGIVRFLLSSVRMDFMEGLDEKFLYYKDRLGVSYINENRLISNDLTTKGLKKRYLNNVTALQYLLTASGKEVENGEIVSSPYHEKLFIYLYSVRDFAEFCMEITNKNSFGSNYVQGYLGFAKEYLRSVAVSDLKELKDFYTSENNLNQNTYIDLYDIARIYINNGEIEAGKAVLNEGIKYEPSYSPINTLACFTVSYNKGDYKEAIEIYEHLRKTVPNFDENQFKEYTDKYYACRKQLGLY